MWSELRAMMDAYGFDMKVTGGSGRKFIKQGGTRSFVVHEPHPHKVLKAYQVRDFIAFLKQEGVIE